MKILLNFNCTGKTENATIEIDRAEYIQTYNTSRHMERYIFYIKIQLVWKVATAGCGLRRPGMSGSCRRNQGERMVLGLTMEGSSAARSNPVAGRGEKGGRWRSMCRLVDGVLDAIARRCRKTSRSCRAVLLRRCRCTGTGLVEFRRRWLLLL